MIDWYVTGSLIGYLAFMLGIGFFFSRRQTSLGNYYLGGRRMNKWVVALSAQASDMSGWLLMGLPGAVYAGGLSEAWIGIGLLAGTYLNWRVVAHRLRCYSKVCGDSITIPDFISNRFCDKTGVSRIVAASVILVFFTFYTASGFVSAAKLFTSIFGIPEVVSFCGVTMTGYQLCLWVAAVVIVAYTLLGGYMAVCWTDFVQGLLMFAAIVLVPALVVCDAGGIVSVVEKLNGTNPALLSFFTNASTGEAADFISVSSCLVWGLGYFGMPHILVRFMSIGDPDGIRHARRIAMTWVTVSLAAAIVIGLVFHVYLGARGLSLDQVGGDPEKVLIVMINGIFNSGFFTRLFAGVLLSAVMAAIMSTADSQLLVSASSFSNDFYKVVLRRNASNRELIAVSRLTVAAVALAALAMAIDTSSDFFKVVMKMVSFAWAGFGAAFGPLILLSLFWKRTTLAGAVTGMMVGSATCFIWKFLLAANESLVAAYPVFGLYELAPAFLLSFITTVLVSLISKPPPASVCREFDRALEVSGTGIQCK